MHIFTGHNRGGRLPAVSFVLLFGQVELIRVYAQAEPQHDVVGGEVGPGEVVVIEVLPDAVKLSLRHRKAFAKLRLRQAFKRLRQRLIFLNPTAWHEPEALRRTVGAMTEQELPLLVLDNQIDGDKRRGAHHGGKIFLT